MPTARLGRSALALAALGLLVISSASWTASVASSSAPLPPWWSTVTDAGFFNPEPQQYFQFYHGTPALQAVTSNFGLEFEDGIAGYESPYNPPTAESGPRG